jgi:hypothetical protein
MALNGNPALALEVHIIQGLRLHIAFVNSMGILQQTVGQCTFAVVDVCYNAKIADISHVKAGKFCWVKPASPFIV